MSITREQARVLLAVEIRKIEDGAYRLLADAVEAGRDTSAIVEAAITVVVDCHTIIDDYQDQIQSEQNAHAEIDWKV